MKVPDSNTDEQELHHNHTLQRKDLVRRKFNANQMANLDDLDIGDSDSYNPSEHIDVEELRLQIQSLRHEIKDDYN